MNLKGIDVEHVVGVSVSEIDLHSKLEIGQVIQIHMDSGEIITLTRTNQTISHHGNAGMDSMTTRGLLLSSDTRTFGSVLETAIKSKLRLTHPLFHNDVENKSSIAAIVLLPGR